VLVFFLLKSMYKGIKVCKMDLFAEDSVAWDSATGGGCSGEM
jgi:hypothetical protein